MAAPLASTTILDGTQRRDIAVPPGTTVGQLLSMLQINTHATRTTLVHGDGSPLDLRLGLGTDLASGTVLTVVEPTENAALADEVAHRAKTSWFRPTLVLSLSAVLVLSLQIAWIIGPAAGWWGGSDVTRWVAGLVCSAVVIGVLRWRPLRHSAAGVLVSTTMLGICGIALLPTTVAYLSQVAFITAAWTALLAALGLWLADRSSPGSAMAAIWAVTSIASTFVVMLDTPVPTAAAVTLALATLAVATVPAFAFRIPENQLLDLPLVTTSAPTVRTPDVAGPSPITARRVRRSLHDADARSQLLLMTCCAAIAAASFPAAHLVSTDHWRGRVALMMMLACVVALALIPRSRRDHVSRILPRGAAVIVLAAMLTAPAVVQTWGLVSLALAAVIGGAALAIAATAFAQGRESAFLGHTADLALSISLFLLLPTALFAAGLFDLVRQWAS